MQEVFWNLLNQVMLSRALFVTADLEIADHLKNQSINIESLAAITKTDAPSLRRLLRFLIAHDVFVQDDKGFYGNNELSSFIMKDHPQTIRPILLHDDEIRWNSFGNLGYCIKTGKPAFDMLYNKSYFDFLAGNPLLSKRFDEAMNIVSEQEDSIIAESLSFSGIVADIGGGQGKLLEKLIKQHSSIDQAILFDLPQVIDGVQNLSESIKKVGGSFFEPIKINADIFILKRVLHDWDDAKSEEILKNIASTMNPSSRLFIIEAIVDRCSDTKLVTDIDLRLFSIFGGEEREYAQFEELCSRASLSIISERPITPLIHIMECQLLG